MLMTQYQVDSTTDVAPSSPSGPPKRKKSRKLSKVEKKENKKAAKENKSGHTPVGARISSESTHSFDFHKTINVDDLSEVSEVDITAVPVISSLVSHTSSASPRPVSQEAKYDGHRPESLIDNQFSFLNRTTSSSGHDQSLSVPNSAQSQKQRRIGRDMSRSSRHQKKSIKADVLLQKLEGSLMLRGKNNSILEELNENDEDENLVSPLQKNLSQVSKHSGVVKQHDQLDREGKDPVLVQEQYDFKSLPNVRKRASILSGPNGNNAYECKTLPLTRDAATEDQQVQLDYDSEFSVDEKDGLQSGDNVVDGTVTPPRVTYPPPVLDASLPDLETEITTPPPFYQPIDSSTGAQPATSTHREGNTPPSSPLKVQAKTKEETVEGPPVGEPPVEETSVIEEPPVIEEPSPPPKKQRKPWAGMLTVFTMRASWAIPALTCPGFLFNHRQTGIYVPLIIVVLLFLQS